MKTIFTMAATGATASTALAYAKMPVWSVDGLTSAAGMGALAGAVAGVALALFKAFVKAFDSSDGDGTGYLLGSFISAFAAVGIGGYTAVKSFNSHEWPLEEAVQTAVFRDYGDTLAGLKTGHVVPVKIKSGNGGEMPLLARAQGEPQRLLIAPDSGGALYLSVCADFLVSQQPQSGGEQTAAIPDDNVTVCQKRALRADEWQQIMRVLN